MNDDSKNEKNVKLITIAEFAARLNVCLPTARRIAIKAGALIKIGGRTTRVDWDKAQKYIDDECVIKE